MFRIAAIVAVVLGLSAPLLYVEHMVVLSERADAPTTVAPSGDCHKDYLRLQSAIDGLDGKAGRVHLTPGEFCWPEKPYHIKSGYLTIEGSGRHETVFVDWDRVSVIQK